MITVGSPATKRATASPFPSPAMEWRTTVRRSSARRAARPTPIARVTTTVRYVPTVCAVANRTPTAPTTTCPISAESEDAAAPGFVAVSSHLWSKDVFSGACEEARHILLLAALPSSLRAAWVCRGLSPAGGAVGSLNMRHIDTALPGCLQQRYHEELDRWTSGDQVEEAPLVRSRCCIGISFNHCHVDDSSGSWLWCDPTFQAL